MRSNTIAVIAIGFGLLAGTAVQSQEAASNEEGNAEFAAARELLAAGREDIIRDEIRFSEEEAMAFWPAYNAYHKDIREVRDRQADVVTAYLRAYSDGTVPKELAESLVDDYLDIKRDIIKVQQKHLAKFRKILPPRKVTRFFQLENKLDAELDVQLARFLPLIDTV